MSQHIHNFVVRNFPASCVVNSFPFAMVFKTTHWCWYRCEHCCEDCGTHRAREYIPQSVITGYIDSALAHPLFDKCVVFTGGEIMSAYLYGSSDYVPNILRHALRTGCSTDIKTNAAWVRGKFGSRIFDDITAVSNEFPDGFQVSLSMDAFHKNALENNVRFVKEVAHRKANISLNIANFESQYGIAENVFVDALRQSGLHIAQGFIVSGENARPVYVINDNIVMKYSTAATPFASGRAENLPYAQVQDNPEFQILSADRHVLVAFDESGRVILGEAARRKIQTTWRNKDASPRDLSAIHDSLVYDALRKEIKHNIKNAFRIK